MAAFATGVLPLPRERKNTTLQMPTSTSAAAARINGFRPGATFSEFPGASYAIKPWLMKSRPGADPVEIAGAGSGVVSATCLAAGVSGSGGVQFATEVGAAESEWLYSIAGFSGIEGAFVPALNAGAGGAGGLSSAFELDAGMPRLLNGVGNSSNSGVPETASLPADGGGLKAGAGRSGGVGFAVAAISGLAGRGNTGRAGGALSELGSDGLSVSGRAGNVIVGTASFGTDIGATGDGGGAWTGSWLIPQKSFTGSMNSTST